jgi:hypothetical protein
MGVRTSACTFILCALVFLCVVFQRFVPFALMVLAVVAALASVFAAPLLIVLHMGNHRDRDDGAKFILLGWLWGLLIVALFFGLLTAWPPQWMFRDTFWEDF